MPTRSKTPCRHSGCAVLLDIPGHCAEHTRQVRRWSDANRGSAAARGYDAEWQKQSRMFLRARPLCECELCLGGTVRRQRATVVDHMKPHRLAEAKQSGDPARINEALALFWDQSNWCPMSKAHHDRKTATKDGGFGRNAAAGRVG